MLLFSFIQSNLCALCWLFLLLPLSTCSQLSSFRAKWHSRLWSECRWGRTLTVSWCSVSDELLMTSLRLRDGRTSEVLLTHPLLSAHPIICPFSLSLFSFELYLLIVLSLVKGTKGPAPSLSPCAEIPHRNMLYSHVDEDDLSNDWQWESLKGVWIISEASLFDSSFGQWIS